MGSGEMGWVGQRVQATGAIVKVPPRAMKEVEYHNTHSDAQTSI